MRQPAATYAAGRPTRHPNLCPIARLDGCSTSSEFGSSKLVTRTLLGLSPHRSLALVFCPVFGATVGLTYDLLYATFF